jgi:fused-like protein
LFRHSPHFYGEFARDGWRLAALLDCVADSDDATQKGGCFALGNLLFHDASFYPRTSQAIPALLKVVANGSEKARANAAGAVGNMGRNSDLLDAELALNHAPERLLNHVVSSTPAPSAVSARL